MRNELSSIKAALSTSPENVSFRVVELFDIPHPVTKSVRGKERGDPDTIEAVLDEATGEPLVINEQWVRYEMRRDNKPSQVEARVKDLLSITPDAPADHYAANCAKARASALLTQIENMQRGLVNPIPDGHDALDKMPLNKHFITSLKHFGIHSIQQLRDATEAEIARLPGGLQAHRLRDEANAFLARNQGARVDELLAKERAEKEQLKAKVEAQDAKLDAMAAMLEQLLAAAPADDDRPKRGRPRLDAAARDAHETAAAV